MSEIQEGELFISSATSVEGWRVEKHYGLVAGEAIIGANVFRDLFAGIRDIVGGRSATYEKGLQQARDAASAEIRKRAAALGANAIIAADIDYEVINQMLMVSISGTAVTIVKDEG